MKKTIKKISFLLFGLMIVSCSDSTEEYLEGNMLEKQFQGTKMGNHVTYENIVTLCKGQKGITRSGTDSAFDIDCIVNDENDTLLYVCGKQEGGWTIYSSDTRVPAIIAQSDEGTFEMLMQNDNAKAWIESIAEDLRIIKSLDDDKLNFSEEEIKRNKQFWRSISSSDEFVKEILKQNTTRGIGDNIVFEPSGHYELVESTTYSEVYDSISRLTTTNWHQDSPYNEYCPYLLDDETHAPAGCVAIAGAQMLYFLHYHFGVPETAPSGAYCYSNISLYPNYIWAQYNYNSTIWDTMNSYYSTDAAPLIADVGRRVNMEYGENGSGAVTSSLVNNVFAPYGISCTYSDYNVDGLKSSLLDGIPVVLSARSLKPTNVFESVGHCFITDRYKRTRVVTRNEYEWIWDFVPPEGGPLPLVPGEVEYIYSSPLISMIGMNWGWGYNPSAEWFSLTGDWYKMINGLPYNFNISRHMIYNFHVAND
jgi:hypothetical protein